jgi:hypothetical protein
MATHAGSFLATRRGRLTLLLVCAVQFLDIADSSIMNVALPSIRRDLGFSVQGLQWVLSGYLLTYGGFLLLAAGPPTCSGGGGCWSPAPRCSRPARWPVAWPRTLAC